MAWTTAAPDGNYESSITVIGEEGVIKLCGQYMEQLGECYNLPHLPKGFDGSSNVYDGYTGSANNHPHVLQNVIDTMAGKEEPHVIGTEAPAVISAIERIYHAAKL
jgi:hypothetical protein